MMSGRLALERRLCCVLLHDYRTTSVRQGCEAQGLQAHCSSQQLCQLGQWDVSSTISSYACKRCVHYVVCSRRTLSVGPRVKTLPPALDIGGRQQRCWKVSELGLALSHVWREGFGAGALA